VYKRQAYGQSLNLGGVRVSLHPAGHILGSAQVCLEYRGERWVVSGDYKLDADGTCAPFEPVRCQVFITETTFGLPIYRWLPQAAVFRQMNAWWRANREAGRVSVVYAYSLGKAQRILAGVDASIGPLVVHHTVAAMNEGYAAAGIALPAGIQTLKGSQPPPAGALVVAPRNTEHARWMSRLPDVRTAFASGWVLVRRQRPAGDPGFVLSDHVDWPQLLAAVEASGADYVLATHGFEAEVVRYLREQGRRADVLGVLKG
jgi:putative mRNA 3-end processing factor